MSDSLAHNVLSILLPANLLNEHVETERSTDSAKLWKKNL